MPIHILREVPVFVSERATSCVRSHSTANPRVRSCPPVGADLCVRPKNPHLNMLLQSVPESVWTFPQKPQADRALNLTSVDFPCIPPYEALAFA